MALWRSITLFSPEFLSHTIIQTLYQTGYGFYRRRATIKNRSGHPKSGQEAESCLWYWGCCCPNALCNFPPVYCPADLISWTWSWPCVSSPLLPGYQNADLGAGSESDQDNPLPVQLSPGVCSCCRGQANTKSNILTKIYLEFRLGATLLSRHGHHLIDPGHCLSQPNGEE